MQTNKKILVVLLAGLLLSGLVSCQKEEPIKHEAAPSHATEGKPAHEGMEGMAGHAQMAEPSKPKTVTVPDDVRASWTSVTIAVQNKETGETKNYEVKPESEFDVPGTNLKLKVGTYLPDFTMTTDQLTSRSNEPNNPALQISVLEDGVEKYKGWLFAKFPAMHAYENPVYGITLVNKGATESSHPSM